MPSEGNIKDEGVRAVSEPDEIGSLISAMKKTPAPDEFENSVLNAIAEGRSEPRSIFQRPSLIAAGAGALLIVGVMVAWLASGGSGDESAAANAKPSLNAHETKRNIRSGDRTETATATGVDPAANTLEQRQGVKPGEKNATAANGQPGGSEDMALSPADGPIMPKEIDPKMRAEADPGATAPISILSIFEFLGMQSQCGSTGCKVQSVSNGSIADQSGVKAGDLITKVDGRELIGDLQFKGTATVKRLTIVRGGKQVEVVIRAL